MSLSRKSPGYLFLASVLYFMAVFLPAYAKTIPDVPFFSEDTKVRMSEGKLFLPHTDFNIPAPGFPLELTRSYCNQSKYYGAFGFGWTSNLFIGIYEQTSDVIKVLSPIGELTLFQLQPDGTYMALEYEKQILVKQGDGSYIINHPNGNKDYLDSSGRLTKKTDSNGNCLTLTYSGSNLVQVTDAVGRSITFSYTGNYITTATEPIGRTYHYEYDGNYNLTRIVDPAGYATQYQYDNQHDLTRIIYPNSSEVNFSYGLGWSGVFKDVMLVKSVTGPEGISRSFGFDNFYLCGTPFLGRDPSTIPRPPVISGALDSKNNYIGLFSFLSGQKNLWEIDAFSGNRITTRNDRLDLLTETDKNNNTWTYTYDTNDNMLTKTSPLNETWTYTYEPTFNKVKTETDPRGAAYITTYDYDAKGNLVTLTDAEGNITTYTYYSNGLLKTVTQPKGNVQNPDGNYTTTFEYDAYGNKTKATDALGNETIYTYDLIGRLLSKTTPEGNTTSYEYDSLSQLKKRTDAKGNTVEYTYDSMGNLITLTQTDRTDPQNPVSAVTHYQYNQLGKVTQITDALGKITQYAYDTEANQIQKIDAEGNKTTYEYPKLNRLTKTNRFINDTQFYTTQYQYDYLGNLTKIIDSNSNSITSEYDKLNRLSKVTDAQNNITQYQYDEVGNLRYLIDANLKTTANNYDKINRLWKTTDAKGQNTQYDYDKNSNRTKIIDANSNTTQFVYDQLNRLILTYYPDNSTEARSYQYNTINKIYKITKTNRKSQAIVYDYDYARRLIKKTYPDTSTVTYAFDGLNRQTDITDQAGTIHYGYDLLGRLTGVTYPDTHTVGYEYNDIGARTKLVYPDSTFITYHYDKLSRLETIKDQAGVAITTYTYDNDLPVITRKDLKNASYATYAYDNLYQLTNVSNRNPAQELISGFTYDYDKIGNRKYAIHNHDAGKGDVYTYDDIYQVTNVKYNIVDPISESQNPGSSTFDYQKTYNLDYVGNRTSVVNGGTVTYSPNNLNQYTSVGSFNYSYDLNGNLTQKTDGSITTTYTYDYENRLKTVTQGANGVAFNYDAFGRRISKEVNGTLQAKYLYDGDNIIAEYNSDNNLLARYIHGQWIDEVISLTRASNTYYYHYDGLGSVTDITDSTGALIEKYTYDAYGNVIIKDTSNNVLSQSAIGNRYLFTGRESDPETGLYYYRARYYDPVIGRFLQTDPVGYEGGVNLYAYVVNNPVNFIDPEGLQAEGLAVGWGVAVAEPTPVGEIVMAGVTIAVARWGIYNFAEHTKGKGGSTWDKHSKKRPGAPEKGDERRDPRGKRPPGWKGPWPPAGFPVCI